MKDGGFEGRHSLLDLYPLGAPAGTNHHWSASVEEDRGCARRWSHPYRLRWRAPKNVGSVLMEQFRCPIGELSQGHLARITQPYEAIVNIWDVNPRCF